MLQFTHSIRRTRAVVRCVLTLLLAMSGIRLYAALPPLVSLVVSVREPLVDENGVRLEGTDPSSVCFQIPAVEGDRVEIYVTSDGQIYPPDAQGDPDYRNQLIKTLSIGSGASPNESNPGKFGCVISPRPAGGTRMFVRIFNAPERQDASYYTDSSLFTVSSVVNEPWWAIFPAAMSPLDTEDDDGDGIYNSREISMGTDPDQADSDGDGISDHDEVIAGTNPANEDSVLTVHNVWPASADQFAMTWPTITGRMYRVEYTGQPGGDAIYSTLLEVRGNGQVVEAVLPRTEGDSVLYRVTAYMESEPE